jgi:DHA1 family multidrug resistance protein-like MFS transporter
MAQIFRESDRKRGLLTLLADTFLMWVGFFMIVPLMSVYYVDRLGWAAASVGLALAVRQFTQQGLTPISGILSDRFGAKGLICIGLLLRSVGFVSMVWAVNLPLLLASVVLAALGGSMFDSPKSAAIAALTDETNRARFYALNGVVGNLGLAIGTQIGVLLLPLNFGVVALGGAACFVATFLVTLFFLPPVRVSSEEASSGKLTEGFQLALHDKPFVVFNVLLTGYWFMWVQLSISLPLAARNIGGSDAAVGWIYALNSGMSIALQYPLMRLASRWLRPLPILIIGVVLMAAGLGGIALAKDVAGLMLCVTLFAAGGLLASPSQQTVTAGLANPSALGSYFGFNSLALAIGGGLGNLSGGLLYDAGKQLAFPQLAWIVFLAVGLLSAIGMTVLASREHRQREQTAPTILKPAPR